MKKIILVLLFFMAIEILSQVIPYKELNTSDDEYGTSFRVTPSGTELWFTKSSAKNPRSKEIATVKVINNKLDKIVPVMSPINPSNIEGNNLSLNGDPVFNFCLFEGYFVSNRQHLGKNYGADIYKIDWDKNGFKEVNRVNELNSEYWDDTPNLHPNNNIMYFSSDRNTPNKGRSDIWFSIFDSRKSNWTKPQMFKSLTDYHKNKSVQTPFASTDGYLYYSTNDSKEGDYDIWRVKLDTDGTPLSFESDETPEKLDWEGVNLDKVDDSHPSFSPGGAWFIFSSNRDSLNKRKLDKDLFYVKLPELQDDLYLTVNLKTRQLNDFTNQYEDTLKSLSNTNIILVNQLNGEKTTQALSEDGKVVIPMKRYADTKPEFDKRIKYFTITADYKENGYFVPIDTLIYDTYCKKEIEHTLTLIDTAIYNDPNCSATFSQKNVQFFVTNYYCPSTFKYKDLGLCTSIFANAGCENIEYTEPEIPCDNNELWSYNLDFKKPKVKEIQNIKGCVEWKEINDTELMMQRSIEVDKAFDNFINVMEAGLKTYCVERSLQNNEVLKVYVMGYADPRSIRGHCTYEGEEIDFNAVGHYIKLEDMDKKTYLKNGVLKTGTPYAGSGSDGNQLLTDVRALHTAWLLDELWAQKVPGYKALREQGLIDLIAEGVGVSETEREEYLELLKKGIQDRYLAEKRKVNVRFDIPSSKGKTRSYDAVSGGKYTWCDDTECMPKASGAKQIVETVTSNDVVKEFKKKRWDFDQIRKDLSNDRSQNISKKEETENTCWSVLLLTTSDKSLVESTITELKALKISITVEQKEVDNQTIYKLRSGCWNESKEAIDNYKTIKEQLSQSDSQTLSKIQVSLIN